MSEREELSWQLFDVADMGETPRAWSATSAASPTVTVDGSNMNRLRCAPKYA
jgi:hypothetical protein